MSTIAAALPKTRNSVCALMRVVRHAKKKRRRQGAPSQEIQVALTFVGTAWCIVESRILVTAHHVLNSGKPRDPNDRFYAFSVPDNGPKAFHFPVAGFLFEDPKSDTAILEIGEPAEKGQRVPPVTVTFSRPPDGTHVLTIGYPAPEIAGANVSPAGEFLGGGQFFLKSHANEGVVAAQYEINDGWYYEFNVGWHHGESGGPVIILGEERAVFSIMQHYRNVKTPHGVFPGPHRGIAIEVIKGALLDAGARET